MRNWKKIQCICGRFYRPSIDAPACPRCRYHSTLGKKERGNTLAAHDFSDVEMRMMGAVRGGTEHV